MSTATAERAVASYARTARPEGVAASYARVSKVREKGAGSTLKTDRQHGANREALARHGHAGATLVEFTDNGISGWAPDAERPGFEALIEGVLAGEFVAVVGFHVDRFSRQPGQVERLLSACRSTGTVLLTALSGPVESALMIRIMAAVAAEESDVKSERQKLKHHQLAQMGRSHGGHRRYGYNTDMTIREDEAAALRHVAGMVLNGESLAACCRWLDAGGYLTVTGQRAAAGEDVKPAPWVTGNLGTMLKREYLAGLRVHRGVVVGDAAWEPIFDRATREALLVKLNDPSRRTNHNSERRYLLSGLALCGECGSVLRGRQNGAGSRRVPSYTCPACAGVHRSQADVDQRVTDWVVDELARLDVRGMLASDESAVELAELTARREDLRTRLASLAPMLADGTLSADAYRAATEAAETEAHRLDTAVMVAEEALRAPVRALEGITGPNPSTVWAELSVARQRAVIELLGTVTVTKAARRGATFDPASVRIEPKAD